MGRRGKGRGGKPGGGKPGGSPGRSGSGRSEKGRSEKGRGGYERYEKPLPKRSSEWRRTGKVPGEDASGGVPGGRSHPDRSGDYVYGVRPVVELLRSGRREVHEVLDASGNGEVAKLARERDMRVREVGRDEIDELVGGVNQGLAARVGGYPYVSLDEILAKEFPLIIVLDEVTDPQNFGAILRVAEGAGASGVVIPKDRSAEVNSTVAKASAGASEHVRVAKVTNLKRALEEIKERGIWAFAAEGEADGSPGADSTLYTEVDFTGAVALVLGSEGKGVRRLVREGCDGGVYLPMLGEVSSLNVSAAAAVLMYEVRRQRGA